jgi:hypothetical protein
MIFDLKFIEECFDFNFLLGTIHWKTERPQEHFKTWRGWINWHNKNPGKPAGHLNAYNYKALKLTFQGVELNLTHHQIMYAVFHNDPEPPMIDHYNGNTLDNSISNLRPVDHELNSKNRVKSVKNKSGITGVRRRTDRKLWVAYIFDGFKNQTKTTSDFFEACCFRKSWEYKLGYTERHGKY